MLCKISKQFTLHPAAILACELHILEVLEGADVVATGVGQVHAGNLDGAHTTLKTVTHISPTRRQVLNL